MTRRGRSIGVPGRGGGPARPSGAEGGFSQHGLPMSLYTDRGAHYFHTPKAGGEIDGVIRPRSGGRSSNSESSIWRLFAPGSRPLRAGVPDAAGPAAQGAQACRRHRHRGGQRFHPRRLSACPQRALCGRAGRRGLGLHSHPGRRSRRDPVRRGGAPGGHDNASPTAPSSCRSPKARCGPIRQGAGQGPRLPGRLPRVFTGQDASAATTERQAKDVPIQRAA